MTSKEVIEEMIQASRKGKARYDMKDQFRDAELRATGMFFCATCRIRRSAELRLIWNKRAICKPCREKRIKVDADIKRRRGG